MSILLEKNTKVWTIFAKSEIKSTISSAYREIKWLWSSVQTLEIFSLCFCWRATKTNKETRKGNNLNVSDLHTPWIMFGFNHKIHLFAKKYKTQWLKYVIDVISNFTTWMKLHFVMYFNYEYVWVSMKCG